ncbi:MAG: hypothetical protein ABL927_12085, partial [Bdellovibrionales bacterium]
MWTDQLAPDFFNNLIQLIVGVALLIFWLWPELLTGVVLMFSLAFRSLISGITPDKVDEPDFLPIWQTFLERLGIDALMLLSSICLLTHTFQISEISIPSELVSVFLQSMTAILAITISVLLLLTQLTSEKYSSVTAHRYRIHGASGLILKLQIFSVFSLGIEWASSTTSQNNFLAPHPTVVGLGLLLGSLSILGLPAFLKVTILQLRPRGLITSAEKIAIEKLHWIRRIAESNNRPKLIHEMVIFHECIQSLRF